MLANQPYTDTATALKDSMLSLIPKSQLDELINLHLGVAKKFIKLHSQNIEEKEKQLIQMTYNLVIERKESIITLLDLVRLTKIKS